MWIRVTFTKKKGLKMKPGKKKSGFGEKKSQSSENTVKHVTLTVFWHLTQKSEFILRIHTLISQY